MEKFIDIAKELLLFFIDFKQDFDLIWHNGFSYMLLNYGVLENMVTLIKACIWISVDKFGHLRDWEKSFRRQKVFSVAASYPLVIIICF